MIRCRSRQRIRRRERSGAQLGIGRDGAGDYPSGLLVHAGGPTSNGWVVSEVWDSKASQEAFVQGRLDAALATVQLPPPAQVIESDTVNLRIL